MITRIDDELELPTTVENDILSRLHDVIEDVEPAVFVLADYDKGVLTEPVIQSVIWHGTRMCVPVIVDPVPANMYSYRNATLVTPNRAEAAQMACDHIKSKVESTADCIRMRCKTKAVLITCGESGAYLFAPTYRHREWIDAKPVPTADTTGAGDTLVAGIAAKLFDDADDILAASRYGVAAATAAVQEHGTSVVRRHEAYRAFVKEPADKVVDLQQVVLLANSAGKVGLPVVTNGVFDLIHRGHYKLLDWAATKGNFLIVLVNSDESTRRLKGDGRPVQSQDLRAEMIACHPRVDAVCIFDGDTPADALAAIGTCHLVKGPDYTIKDVVSRADVLSRGGEVSTMPTGSKTDGLSTTKTIDTVKNGD
jgi:D-beta-D-heptose 7-phosphate kinase/D-beta-D-heptose 1-phosphate adenosyltransferase